MTATLPFASWYTHELEYWGADYPPVCLFVHFLFSKVLHMIPSDPLLTDLSLRGYEGSVAYMRLLNIACEYSLLLLTLYYFLPRATSLSTVLTILSMPLIPLVDHGHFQVSNSIPLSLTALSVAAATSNHASLACVLFTLSLLMKQMSLYFAPVFFFFLLKWSIPSPKRFLSLALPVLVTIALAFAPFPPSQYGHILQRIFPFHRGLFESKVSSLWCFLDTYPMDIRRRVPAPVLSSLCLLTTLSAIAPSCYVSFSLAKPTRTQLLKLLHQCALSFFLFSFHVHEKTILFPLFPLLLLFDTDACYVALQVSIGICSCWFLFVLDGLEIEMFAALLWWAGVCVLYGEGSAGGNRKSRKSRGWMYEQLRVTVPVAALVAMLGLIGASHGVPPPERLPDLYPVLVSAVGFGAFAAAWVKATVDVVAESN